MGHWAVRDIMWKNKKKMSLSWDLKKKLKSEVIIWNEPVWIGSWEYLTFHNINQYKRPNWSRNLVFRPPIVLKACHNLCLVSFIWLQLASKVLNPPLTSKQVLEHYVDTYHHVSNWINVFVLFKHIAIIMHKKH